MNIQLTDDEKKVLIVVYQAIISSKNVQDELNKLKTDGVNVDEILKTLQEVHQLVKGCTFSTAVEKILTDASLSNLTDLGIQIAKEIGENSTVISGDIKVANTLFASKFVLFIILAYALGVCTPFILKFFGL